jgi:3-oxoacyl-[acyl-carrier-protein] synthase II
MSRDGRDVLVTGFGVRTAFGDGAGALRDGVFDGRPAFAPITRFDPAPYRTGVAAAGGGSAPLREVLAETTAAAVAMAGLPKGARAAVLVGTAGDFTGLTRFWRADAAAGAEAVGGTDGLKGVAETVPGRQAEALADEFGLRGPRMAFTAACVASATAVIHACRLIAAGRIDAAVCAGAYLVEEENLAKFGSGFALSHDGMVRPFCADRSGLLLGDGAAALVLESAESAARRGAPGLGALTGWGAAGDAYHVALPHPQAAGLVSAARQALRRAGDPRVDYVNAHGTATKVNDPAETRGFRELFGREAGSVPISSTKSTTGHMLEAAGVVELVITLLALRDGVVPPTAGFTEPDAACDLDYVPNRPRRAEIRRALCVNAAFGGANTALILERA